MSSELSRPERKQQTISAKQLPKYVGVEIFLFSQKYFWILSPAALGRMGMPLLLSTEPFRLDHDNTFAHVEKIPVIRRKEENKTLSKKVGKHLF
jgi:hypothetical protein